MNTKDGELIIKKMYFRCVKYSYIGSLVLMINSVIDGMLIAHFLGEQATASFGLIMPVYSLINLIPILLRSSVQTKIGEHLGRGDTKAARHCLFIVLTVGTAAAAILFIMFTFWGRQSISLLSAGASLSNETISMASDYLHFISVSVFPIIISSVLHPVMQLDGDIKRSAGAIQVGTVVNIAGDLINVLALHGGMAGMAIATDLSCFAELAWLLLHYRRTDCILKPALSNDRIDSVSLFTSGLPFMIRELTAFISGILLNRMVFNLSGATGVSILCVGNTIWLFMLPAAMAISSAGNTLGGVCAGESDRRGTQLVFKMGIWYSLIPGVLLAAVFFLLAPAFAAFCGTDNKESTDIEIFLLRLLSLSLPVTMICQATESNLNVTGRRKQAVVLSILEGGMILLGVSWILGNNYGIWGIWVAKLAAPVVIAIFGFVISTLSYKAFPKSDYIETSVSTRAEVIGFSEEVRTLCRSNKMDSRHSNLAALCVEELACNILQWGYEKGAGQGVDLRAAFDEGHIIIRIRDSGKQFDPVQYTRQFVTSGNDPLKNFGLRIVSGSAEEIHYSCIADCNVVLLKI